jgi:hypothetical protein
MEAAVPTAVDGPTTVDVGRGVRAAGRLAGAGRPADDLADEFAAMDAAIDALRAADRECAVATAARMAALLKVADLTGEPRLEADQAGWVLSWTPRHAQGEIAWGRQLIEFLPEVWRTWRSGAIDQYRALIFVDVLAPCFADQPRLAGEIAAQVLPGAGQRSGPQLRQRLRRLLYRALPDAAERRVRASLADRDVHLIPADDGGTATLTGVHLPAARAAAAFERVDAIARACRASGDERTLSQLRAETFCDLLDGTGLAASPIARPGSIELTIPLATAIGAGTEPGELAGFGPVLADVARQIAAANDDTQWRFSVSSDGRLVYAGTTTARPDTAAPLDPHMFGLAARPRVHLPRPPVEVDSRTRMPGAALRRWIHLRDRRCQAPGCNAPARVCDIDHTTAYGHGGSTEHHNLALLCRRHHRLKHLGVLRVIQPRPGLVLWITRTGHIFWRDD